MTLIAQFVDTHVFGGAEALAVTLCKELNARGHASVVFHLGNPEMEEYCKHHRVTHYELSGLAAYRSWKTLPSFSWAFARTLRNQGVGLLHSHLFGSVIAGSMAATLARIPHVGTLHDLYTLQESPKRIRALQACAFLSTRLVTVAKVLETYCRAQGSFSTKSLRTIHNAVQISAEDKNRSLELKRELGLSEGAFTLISVGRLVPLKQQKLLLEAVALLRSANLRLLIVGDGPERERLETQAQDLGISPQVRFLGYRSDIADLLHVSDAFALVSSTECLSCSILEAMAAGLPILATDVGGNAELVENGINGFLLPERANDLAQHIELLLGNIALRQQMGQQSLRISQASFSLDTMVANYQKLFVELS